MPRERLVLPEGDEVKVFSKVSYYGVERGMVMLSVKKTESPTTYQENIRHVAAELRELADELEKGIEE